MTEEERDRILFKTFEGVNLALVGIKLSQYTVTHADRWLVWRRMMEKYCGEVEQCIQEIQAKK